jgi:hypothetical protein
VVFDLNNDGSIPLDWVGPQNPFLALDLNGDGVINNGSELFGTAMLVEGRRAKDGFEALGQYDGNKDGLIDAKDDIFTRLLLWFDKNSDGVSQPEELTSLNARGIRGIHLTVQPGNQQAPSGNALVTVQSTFDEGFCSPNASMTVSDIWIKTAK